MVKLSLKAILIAGIGLVISSLISGYFFSIGASLWELTIEGKLDLGSPFWLVSVPLGIIGILLLIYGIYLGRHKPISQGENIIISAPSQKRASWLSMLRRPPIWEGKQRIQFWTTAITIEIIGPIFIYVFYLLFFSIPESAKTFSLVTAITGIGAIVAFMVLFAWLAIAELYARWKYHKIAYLNVIKKFDRAFEAVREESDPDLLADTLMDFQDQLHTLCHNYEWSKVNDKIEKVLEHMIPEKLFNEPQAKRYIQFLTIIIDRFGEHVIDAISKKWLKEIDKFYDDPNYSTTSISNVLYILLQLRGYSKDYLTKLIDDAATRWSELKYQMLEGDLELAIDELKKRNELAHEEIISYLRRKIRDAKQDKDERAFNRLSTLFRRANR